MARGGGFDTVHQGASKKDMRGGMCWDGHLFQMLNTRLGNGVFRAMRRVPPSLLPATAISRRSPTGAGECHGLRGDTATRPLFCQ